MPTLATRHSRVVLEFSPPLPLQTLLCDDIALPALDAPAPLETLWMGFAPAARSHAALARLATLRTLQLWGLGDPPSATDAAALLAALAGLKGILVLWQGRQRFRPSDPLQMAGLALVFTRACPALSSVQLPAGFFWV